MPRLWDLQVRDSARKSLDKMDKAMARRILERLDERVLKQDNPKQYAKPLRHGMLGFWRLRVENYRVIFRIVEDEKIIDVTRISHRKDVYAA